MVVVAVVVVAGVAVVAVGVVVVVEVPQIAVRSSTCLRRTAIMAIRNMTLSVRLTSQIENINTVLLPAPSSSSSSPTAGLIQELFSPGPISIPPTCANLCHESRSPVTPGNHEFI